MSRIGWTRDQLLIAFNLYCRIPFGQLHSHNPEIISVAQKLGRTPGALAMKLVNFASFDPIHKKRNVKGLGHAAKGDREIWEEFNDDWEKLAFESQQTLAKISGEEEIAAEEAEFEIPERATEIQRLVRVRTVQRFFRESVLASYKYRCAICGLSLTEMLCASHIIPWAKNVERRADPTNGLSLCSFHDRAFDRGLISLDEKLHVVVSKRVLVPKPTQLHDVGLIKIEGQRMLLPERFPPDYTALSYHRENIFRTQNN